ncbi:hypothetical protein CDL12_03636 [Handroanthus impetiginosus]|uniref:DUF4220 domain-containing protein n=1 Tax=Handroanthus impetiginosus TaxID=429701 RepID=A0A2G9I1K0_9LAMI|nr:hypothetical protein CDL12_03636 [Handroanthus impetiginosus]
MSEKIMLRVPDKAKRLWDEWNIRCAVLISLLFQVVLIFSANSRKRTGGRLMTALIWSVYLLADWIAAFAVGLISSGQSNDCPEKVAVRKELAAFWAPFLLLHLGGPDVITAFSLEDNELWIRHLLGLMIQLLAVAYVFTQSLPNEFWIPTLLMFLAGSYKYAERTCALYKACLGNFKRSLLPKPDAGPNYAKLMEEYSAIEASQVPVNIEIVNEPEKDSAGTTVAPSPNDHMIVVSESEVELSDREIVTKGYEFFNTFKGLVVDHMFSFHERNESRKFFFQRTASDAFKVMEVELNFIYDALFTKMAVVHCKTGYLFRFLCAVLIVLCFQQFVSHHLHTDITLFDKIVTYILLGGAVCLEFVAFFNLVLSDWAIVSTTWIADLTRPCFCKGYRWSNTMSQHSFISFCLKERSKWVDKIADFCGIKETLDEFRYKGSAVFEDDLKEFIFKELKAKAEKAKTTKDAKEIYSSRGDGVLWNYPSHYPHPSISSSISDEVEYDESLMLWHIATELLYSTSSNIDQNGKFCKILSDYMLYLLVMRPMFMSAVAGIAQIRFQDTREEAKKFFQRWESELTPSAAEERHKQACKKLLEVKTTVVKADQKKTVIKPNEVKGDRSKSVLFDACILANDLEQLGESKKWEVMSKVWVELLCYAASHCRPNAHAQQLSKGGELITFVWLLMAHFGLGEQFRIESGHARAKLLVTK